MEKVAENRLRETASIGNMHLGFMSGKSITDESV